jgi:type I site-specific restriction-modification system R (restriction) subunit
MSKEKVVGGAGITAGGDVTFGDVSGQIAIGSGIVQNHSIGQTDLEELRKSLLDFQKEVAKLSLSSEDQSIVSDKISEAVKEAKKENPALPTIKERFESAINIVKEAGKAVKDISELYEPAKKIAKLVGISLSLFL